jgi:hypothetical protein
LERERGECRDVRERETLGRDKRIPLKSRSHMSGESRGYKVEAVAGVEEKN